MFRINVWHIVKDHFKSLWLEYDGKIKEELYWGDKFMFFIVPIGLTVALIYNDVSLKSQVGNLIKALAIFGAFLFNLLAVIHGQLDKIKSQTENINNKKLRNRKERFAKDIHANITFCILLSIGLIVLMLIYDLTPLDYDKIVNMSIIKLSLAAIYCLLTLFGLTLLMVINRVYILVRH